MSTPLSIAALAVPALRANAVGVVRFVCRDDALALELRRVARFAPGFAPGGVTESVKLVIPYQAVRGIVRQGPLLCLAIDPGVAFPHNRFALTRFARVPAESLAGAYRVRALADALSRIVPAVLGLLAVLAAPKGSVGGFLGRASLGVLVTVAAFSLLRGAVRWGTRGGPRSDRYRDALEAELSRRLGLAPAPLVGPPVSALLLADEEEEEGASPGWAGLKLPLVSAGFALAVVVTMIFVRRFGTPAPPPPRVERAHTGVAAAVTRARLDPEVFVPPVRLPRCSCQRADSPLWKGGAPALSILTFVGDDGAAGPIVSRQEGKGPPHFDFNLVVVNDSARPMRDVRVTLTFARRTGSGRRVGAVDRGLFWGGELAPAAAVKWHVSAPGSEMRIDTSEVGTLEARHLDPAPADAFVALASSGHRAVRFHAAEMLAYVRDPRATDVALRLGVEGAEERVLVARILRASASVIPCDVARRDGELQACVFNGASSPADGLELEEAPAKADPSEPVDAAARAVRFPIDATIGVHEGVVVRFPFEGTAPDDWLVAPIANAAAPP